MSKNWIFVNWKEIYKTLCRIINLTRRGYIEICIILFCLMMIQCKGGFMLSENLYRYDYGYIIPCLRVYRSTGHESLSMLRCLRSTNLGYEWYPQYFFCLAYIFYVVLEIIKYFISYRNIKRCK